MYEKLREVVLEITQQCNLHCMHCGSRCVEMRNTHELTTDEWRVCFEQLGHLGVSKVVCSGGEPMVRPDIVEIIEYLGVAPFAFGMITNGLQMRQVVLDALVKAAPFSIGVSIDGLPDTHNMVRGNDQSWNKAITTLSRLQDVGISVCAITTVHRRNQAELPILAEFFARARVPVWQVQIAMPAGRMEDVRNLILNEGEFTELCDLLVHVRREYSPDLMIEAADCFGPAPQGWIRSSGWSGCSAGLSSMAIDAQGNGMPCLSIRHGDMYCGNVREVTIEAIWNGLSFNRSPNVPVIGAHCASCATSAVCRGGCASMSMATTGSFHNSPYCFLRSFATQHNT